MIFLIVLSPAHQLCPPVFVNILPFFAFYDFSHRTVVSDFYASALPCISLNVSFSLKLFLHLL